MFALLGVALAEEIELGDRVFQSGGFQTSSIKLGVAVTAEPALVFPVFARGTGVGTGPGGAAHAGLAFLLDDELLDHIPMMEIRLSAYRWYPDGNATAATGLTLGIAGTFPIHLANRWAWAPLAINMGGGVMFAPSAVDPERSRVFDGKAHYTADSTIQSILYTPSGFAFGVGSPGLYVEDEPHYARAAASAGLFVVGGLVLSIPFNLFEERSPALVVTRTIVSTAYTLGYWYLDTRYHHWPWNDPQPLRSRGIGLTVGYTFPLRATGPG